MESILLGHRALVEERYRSIEAARQRQDRIVLKERAEGPDEDANDGADDEQRGGRDVENNADQAHDILAEVADAVRSHCAHRPATYSRKKEVVLGSIMRSLYSSSNAQSPGGYPSDEARHSSKTAIDGTSRAKVLGPETNPANLGDLDAPTQFALRMFFRLCRSVGDPERLHGNTRLALQIAHRLPSILVDVPPCMLAPGFSDAPTVGESGDVLSVFSELFELFGKLLELPTTSQGLSSRGNRQLEAGVTLPAVSASEHGSLSCTDRCTVVIAYLALALKMGRLCHLLTALQHLTKCDPDTITAAQLEQIHPLFEELASARAEIVHEAPDQEDTVAGFVMSFGKGDHGKLGHGQCTHAGCQDGNCTENKASPTIIEATREIKFAKIDSLSTHSIGITTAGEIMAWGNGDKYRLGHGSTSKEYVPRVIEALTVKGRVRDISCGLGHTLALMDSGELYAWGNGSNGRLGLGDALDRSNPTLVSPASIITARSSDSGSGTRGDIAGMVRLRNIFCGASHSMAISWDGRLFCWGKNNQGQCGHGHSNDQLFVQEVTYFADGTEDTVVSAAGGWEHSLFCTSSGRVFACGCGYKDSRRTGVPPVLGLGDFDRRLKPSVVVAFADAKEEIVKVSCGWDHSIAISSTGQVFTWGSGANGKLGHGDEESCDLPTLVKDMDGKVVVDAKAGCEHTVLLTANHEVWTFGHGDSGRLGHGDSQTRKSPTRIEHFSQSEMKPVAIAAGDKYNLLLVAECETEELSSHESINHRVSSKRRKVSGQGFDMTLPGFNDFGCGGSHAALGTLSTTTHPSQTFQSNWVLSLLESSPTGEVVGSPRYRPPVLPTTIRSTVLFVLGHIDRVATEYGRTGYDGESEDAGLKQAAEAVMPFAIDTSAVAVRTLSELLASLVPTLHELKSTQDAVKSSEKHPAALFSRDMMAQDRPAVALSLLRILQLNIFRMAVQKLQATVDEGKCFSDNDQLVKGVFDQVSRIVRLDDDKLVHLLCAGDENQVNGGSQRFLAVRHEAAMVLKAGFGLFYPDTQAHYNLLNEIINTTKDSGDKKSTWIAVLASCLNKDKVMKPLFHSLVNSDAVRDLQPMLHSLLELCTEQERPGIDWPSRILQVILLHWLALMNQLINRSQSSASDTHAASNATDGMLKLLPDFIKRMVAYVTKVYQTNCQEEALPSLDRVSVCTLFSSVVESLCSMFHHSNDKNRIASLIRLALVERLLPELRGTLPILESLVSTVDQLQDHACDSGIINQDQHGCSSATQCDSQANRLHLVELSSSCCSLYGILCAEALRFGPIVDNMSGDELAKIKGTVDQNERSQIDTQHDDSIPSGKQDTKGPLSVCIQLIFDRNNVDRTLLPTALREVTAVIQTLATDSSKLAILSEITGVLFGESKRHHDRDLQVDEAVTDFYMSVTTLLDEHCHSSALVEEVLALWCIPLTAFGMSSDKAADTVIKAGVVQSLQKILLRHQDVVRIRLGLPCAPATNRRHGHVGSSSQDVSRADLQSALPPKLKQALLPLFTDTSSFEGAGALAWEALCAIALQFAQTNDFQQLGVASLLQHRQTSLTHMESEEPQSRGKPHGLPKTSKVETLSHSIRDFFDALYCLLQRDFEAQEQLRATSQHLASLVTESTSISSKKQANTQRWREQSRVFFLANPVVASAGRHQTVGLTRSVVPSGAAVDNDSSVEGKMNEPTRFSFSLWLYANMPHQQVSTASKHLLTQPTNAEGLKLPPESICLLAVGGVSFQVAGGISNFPDVKSPVMILAAAPATDESITLSLITASACGGDIVYERIKLGDGVPAATWCHLALVASSTRADALRVFINGVSVDVPNESLQFDEDFFDEAFNWSTAHIGGQMNGTSLAQPAPIEAQSEASGLTTELSVVLDDVWMIGRGITTEAIEHLYLGGPVLFQIKRQSLLEDRCFDVVRLLHAMVANADPTPAVSLAETLNSDQWIMLLIQMHTNCVRMSNSASVVYLTEILARLLPIAPASSTVDLLDLGHACFSQFILDRSNEGVLPVYELLQLESDGSRPQHEDIPFSKRRELFRALLYRRCVEGTNATTFDKRGGNGEGESLSSKEGEIAVVYAAGLRLFHKLVASPRWTPWMENQVELLVSDPNLDVSSTKLASLNVVIAILSGYPVPISTGTLQVTSRFSPLPSRILCHWSDSILSPSMKESRLKVTVVTAIRKLFIELLGSTKWQAAQIQLLQNVHSPALELQLSRQAELVTMINFRTRMLRVVASQLLSGKETVAEWKTLLFQNPSICLFLLQTASASVTSTAKSIVGFEPSTPSSHLHDVHGFMKQLRDTCRWPGSNSQLQTELEALQWRVWSALQAGKEVVQDKLLSFSPEILPKATSPLATVAGKVDLYALQVFAREGFPTVKLPTSTICASSGLWFYEVVLLTNGLMQIGFLDEDFSVDPAQGQGVGDHASSWAFDGYRCKKWNVSSQDYGERWHVNDIVGVLLDTDRMEISFFLNGKFLGVAFGASTVATNSLMVPAASLSVCQAVEFVIGPPNEVIASARTSADRQELYQEAFRFWPVLESQQDQRRLKPVIAAMTTTEALQQTERCETSALVGACQPCSDDGDSVEDDSDIDHDYGALRTNSSFLGADEADTTSEGTMTERAIAFEVRRHPVQSRDGQDCRLFESSLGAAAINAEKDEESSRRRELVDGLTSLGIPFEWALRCALETTFSINESGSVSWVLEQMEKQAGQPGGWLPPTNAEGEMDGAEIRWPSQASVRAVGASHSAGYIDGLAEAAGSSRSINSAEEGEKSQSENIALDDHGSRHRYNVVPPSLLAAPGAVESKCSTAPIAVDVGEEPLDLPSEHFTADIFGQDRDELFDSVCPPMQRAAPAPSGTPTDKSAQRSEKVTSSLPLCIAVDTVLMVNYSRLALTSLFETTGDSSNGLTQKLYRLVVRWIDEEPTRLALVRFFRVANGLSQGEPRLVGDGAAFLRDCSRSPSLQLEQTMLSMLDEELQQRETTSTDGWNESAASRFPLFGLLFESMQLICLQAVSITKAFSRKQQHSTDLESLTLDAAWLAWLGGVIFSHAERVMRREIKSSSSNAARFAQTASSTCYSLVFFKQLAKIALQPAPCSMMQWKYVAIKLLARICSSLKSAQAVAPQNSLSSGAECGQSTWFCDPTEAFQDSLSVRALVELFTLRFRRESTSRVYISEISSAILELLNHLARPLSRQRDIVANASQTHEMHVDKLSSTSISVSWRHRQSAICSRTTNTAEETAVKPTDNVCDQCGANIVALHVEAIPSSLTTIACGEKENEVSLRVLPCQGTTTLRNLAPDTTYRVWLTQFNSDGSVGTQDDSFEGTCSKTMGATLDELEVQTPVEPPFEFDPTNAGKNLVVLKQNLTVKNAINKKWHSVRGTVGFEEGVHHWQVRIDVCVSKNIFIGVCTAQASLENYIGSDAFGYGFLANKAIWNNKTKLHSYGEIFKQGDVIRVTLDCNTKTLAFSRNGESLGAAATNIRPGGERGVLGADNTTCKWFPAFSLYNKDDQLTLIPPATSIQSSVAEPHQMVSQYSSVDESIVAMRRLDTYKREICIASWSAEFSDQIEDSSHSFEAIDDAYQFFRKWRMGHMIVREIELGRLIFINSCRQATEKYGLHAGDTVFTSQGQCVVLGESHHHLWYEVDSISSFETSDQSQQDRKVEVAAWSRSHCLDMLKNADEFPIHRLSDGDEKGPSHPENLSATVTAEQFRNCQSVWSRSSEVATWDFKLVSALDSLALARRDPSTRYISYKVVATALLGGLIPLEQFQAHFDVCSEQFGGEHHLISCLLMRSAFLITLNVSVYRAARFVMPTNHFARLFPGASMPTQGSTRTNDPQPAHEGAMAMVMLASMLCSPRWTTCGGLSSSQTTRGAIVRALFQNQKERLMREDLEYSMTAAPVVSVRTSTEALDEAVLTPASTDLPTVSVSYPARARASCFWQLLRSKSATSEYPSHWLLPKKSHAMTTLFAQLSKQLATREAMDWRREVTRAFDALPIRQTFAVSVSSVMDARRYSAGGSCESSSRSLELDQPNDGSSGNEADESTSSSSTETDLSVEYLRLLECAANEIQSPDFPLFSPVPLVRHHPNPTLEASQTSVEVMIDVNTSLFMPAIVRNECCYYPTRSELLGWYFHAGQLIGIAWRSRALLPLQFMSKALWDELVDPIGEIVKDTRPVQISTASGVECSNDDVLKARARAREEAIDVIRDGLLSIVPSRCLMLCGSGEELRARLSDLDVQFVDALHSRAVYNKTNRHHRLFWAVVREFSGVERNLLAKFISAGRSSDRKVNDEGGLVLELADALHDGRDRPDACYPVMTLVNGRTRRLHLPEYSSATALRTKLTLAMTNLQLE